MYKITKKILCTTAITAILNLSFQPAYAVKIEELDDSTNHSTSRPLMKEDLSAKTLQTSVPTAHSWMPELVKEAGSYSFSALKRLAQLPRLASRGLIYATKHPLQALAIGLAGQVTTTTALNTKRTIENEFGINQDTRSSVVPCVTALTNGNVFVVWENDPTTSTYYQDSYIYGRIFSPNGVPLGNEFSIYQNITGLSSPFVSGLTNGNAFVVWQGEDENGNQDLYGKVLSPKGAPLGNIFQINNQVTTGDQWNPWGPSVAGLSNGNVFVAWGGGTPDNFDMYGRFFSSNGVPLNNNFRINQNTTVLQENPSVVSLTNGNAFVAWEGEQVLASYTISNIYGRIFSSNGVPLGNEFPINQNIYGSRGFPSVASLINGNVFVTWMDTQVLVSYTISNIYGRILSSNGTPLGNAFSINQNTTSSPYYYPSVVGLTNGNAFVAWWSASQNGTGDVYGRILSSNGVPLSNEFMINQNTPGTQYLQSIVPLTNGNVFVAWNEYNNGTGNIYGRVFFPNGTAFDNEFMINQDTTSSIKNLASN